MKKYKIIFSPRALPDMREARLWYNLQQRGLGKRFTEDVRKLLVQLNQIHILLLSNLKTSERLHVKLFLMQFIMKLTKKKC